MVFRDLRDWIAYLEGGGEVIRLGEEVRLEPDVGGIGRAICDLQAPAVFAERVTGYTTPIVIGLHAAWRRVALASGLPKTATPSQQVKAWRDFFQRPLKAMRWTEDAPCKENILTGDKIDLFKFPIPRLNINDASFYLSKPMVITKDRDTGWVNIGMYRMMIQDRNKTCILFSSTTRHIYHHWTKYYFKGEDMPVAVALGTEPVLPMVAGAWQPVGWGEYEFAGAIRGEPEEVVKAETCDLPVPARAEIVLEGVLKHDERQLEGPFGEWSGAYSGFWKLPVFEITCITYRNNPIYDCLYMGKTPAENHYMTTPSKLAGTWNTALSEFPNITDMAFTPPYCSVLVIQGRWTRPGQAKEVMLRAAGGRDKVVIAVDEDINPWDGNDVMWALATRVRGDVDISIIPGCLLPLDPAKSPQGATTRVIIDATKSLPPYHRYEPVAWVTPRPESALWKEKLRKIIQERKNDG